MHVSTLQGVHEADLIVNNESPFCVKEHAIGGSIHALGKIQNFAQCIVSGNSNYDKIIGGQNTFT